MTPFSNFNHLIAYFLPGVITFGAILMFISLLLSQNIILVVTNISNLLFFILGSSMVGLITDEIRATYIEPVVQQRWATDEKLDKIDQLSHSNLELLRFFSDEFFYFYQFDINMAIGLFILAIASPIYLGVFYNINLRITIITSAMLIIIAEILRRCAKTAYQDFVESCSS